MASASAIATATCRAMAAAAAKLKATEREVTPSTTCPETDDDCEEARPKQLQAGLFEEDLAHHSNNSAPPAAPMLPVAPVAPAAAPVAPPAPAAAPPSCGGKFEVTETFFIFDWDDTVLPSSWVNHQGLRLDAASRVTPEQREVLAQVANAATKTLQAARQHGTVVLVTNAERGWIELSCQKFLPTLMPILENVKLVSARTAFEGAQCRSPVDWKLCAFDREIKNYYGEDALVDATKRKNVFSLGDSVHEREALLRATASLPNCRSKSLKFVERPDYSQICKQHELFTSCFDQIVHHDANLDMCIRCP